MNSKKQAIRLFLEKTFFFREEIKKIEPIKSGFSNNDNYLFTLNDGKRYQVKIPLYKNITFPDVEAALLYEPEIYIHLDKTGRMIKHWVDGKHFDLSNKIHGKWVLEEVKKIHQIKVEPNKFGMYGTYAYRETTKIDEKLIEEFDVLSKELGKHSIVFTHGDLNVKNILITPTRAFLIDFEWAKMGYAILDYATLLAFSEISIKIVMEFTDYTQKELLKMVRFVLIHTLMWCEKENTHKSSLLEKQIIEKLNR